MNLIIIMTLWIGLTVPELDGWPQLAVIVILRATLKVWTLVLMLRYKFMGVYYVNT